MRWALALLLVGAAFAANSTFSIEHSPGLAAGQTSDYWITVFDSGSGSAVSGAKASVLFEKRLLASQLTDSRGFASFKLLPSKPGSVTIEVSKEGYNPYFIIQEIAAAPATGHEGHENATVDNSTSAATGFVTLSPSDQSVFWFAMLVVLASFLGAAWITWQHEIEPRLKRETPAQPPQPGDPLTEKYEKALEFIRGQ
jgi:hypothetical protein